jgi:hypothetical protein
VYTNSAAESELAESGIFYDPALPANERAMLLAYCQQHKLTPRTLESFVREVFYRYGYELRGTIVGINLPFDLAHIAISAKPAKRDMYGGFSLKLSPNKRLPAVQVKHVSRRFSLMRFAAPFRPNTWRSEWKKGRKGPIHRGFFVDIATLGTALFARSFSLASLGEFLKVPHQKLDTEEHGLELTSEYINYAVRDVQTTWECYAELCVATRRLAYDRNTRPPHSQRSQPWQGLPQSYARAAMAGGAAGYSASSDRHDPEHLLRRTVRGPHSARAAGGDSLRFPLYVSDSMHASGPLALYDRGAGEMA